MIEQSTSAALGPRDDNDVKSGELRLAISPMYTNLDRIGSAIIRLDTALDRLGGVKPERVKEATDEVINVSNSLLGEMENIVRQFNTTTNDLVLVADRMENLI